MRSILISLFIVGVSISTFSQIEIKGTVKSSLEDINLSDVQILDSVGNLLAVSDDNGDFSFNSRKNKVVSFNHIGYSSLNYTVQRSNSDLIIYLDPKDILLNDADVGASLPEIVFSSEHLHVADYIFSEEGIYVLTYSKKRYFKSGNLAKDELLSDCRVLLLNDELEIISKSISFQDGISLFKDISGQIFLKTLNHTYFVYLENEHLFSTEVAEQDFSSLIEPVVYLDDELMIYSNFDETFPQFSYFVSHHQEEAYEICTITDSVLLHTFRAQYRDLQPREKLEAFRTELRTGIDKEIVSGYMTGFHQSIYFKPPYAPIFYVDSGFVVFNTISSYMSFYNMSGVLKQMNSFTFHQHPKQKGWKKEMVQDNSNLEIYAVYEKNGIATIKSINHENASEQGEFKLTYKYPLNVQVKDGYVYYLYRPFESSQKHYLYKEEIAYN